MSLLPPNHTWSSHSWMEWIYWHLQLFLFHTPSGSIIVRRSWHKRRLVAAAHAKTNHKLMLGKFILFAYIMKILLRWTHTAQRSTREFVIINLAFKMENIKQIRNLIMRNSFSTFSCNLINRIFKLCLTMCLTAHTKAGWWCETKWIQALQRPSFLVGDP